MSRRGSLVAAAFSLCAALAAVDVAACSRVGGKLTRAQQIDNAEEIFVAHVVAVTERHLPAEDGEPPEPYVEGRYVLVEALKGDVAREGVVHDAVAGPTNCSLPLMAGWDYVFFVDLDDPGSVDGVTFRGVGSPDGSMPIGPPDEAPEDPELAELKALVKSSVPEESP